MAVTSINAVKQYKHLRLWAEFAGLHAISVILEPPSESPFGTQARRAGETAKKAVHFARLYLESMADARRREVVSLHKRKKKGKEKCIRCQKTR